MPKRPKIVHLTVLTLITVGNAVSLLGQTTLYEESRFGNNTTGSNNPDFAFGSAISSTISSIKNSAPGLPGDSSSCRFFPNPGSASSSFTVSPSGAYQLTLGESYAVAVTFGNNGSANQHETADLVVNLTDTGTTGFDTFVGTSSVFATTATPVNTWGTIGHVTINSSTPTFTFAWSSGFSNTNRWYVDTVRFIPLGTLGAPEYWEINGTIGGTGAWDTTSTNWNPNADGSGTPATYSSSGLAIFGGNAGTVSVDPGGIIANGGIEFDVAGYTVQAGPLTLGSAPSIWVASGASVTINSVISGTNGLVLPANGTVNLGAPLTGLTGLVNLGAGTLNLAPTGSQSLSSLTGGGALNLGSATLTVGSDDTSTTYAGILSDAGSGSPGALIKTGAGTLGLRGANTFAGPTTINGGTLSITAENGLGAVPGSLDPSHLNLNGNGACLYSAKTSGILTLSANRGITLNGSNVIAASASAREITFNCPITGSGSVNLPGVWPDFNVANSFTGDLIFAQTNNCSIRFNADNSAGFGMIHIMPLTPSGTPNTIRNLAPTGASTTLTNAIFYDESISHCQNYNIDTAGTSGSFTLSGKITGTAVGGVNINDNSNGGGTVTLSGDNSGFGGGFNLEGGILVLGSPTALGSGLFVINNVGGSTQTLQAALPLTGASAITNTVYLNTSFGFTLSGSNPFQFSGPFHLGAGPNDSIEVDTPTTISGNMDDQGFGYGLTLNSANGSTLVLTGTNSYTGGTTIISGTLDGATAHSIAGDLIVNGGTLQLDNAQAMPFGSTLTINASSVNLNFTGYQTNAALIVFGVPQTSGVYNASSPGLSGTLTGTGNLVVSPNFAIVSESLDQTGTNLVVCWQSTPGQNYDVLTNGDVTMPANWSAINGTVITATSPITCYTLPSGIASSNLFVRIRKDVP